MHVSASKPPVRKLRRIGASLLLTGYAAGSLASAARGGDAGAPSDIEMIQVPSLPPVVLVVAGADEPGGAPVEAAVADRLDAAATVTPAAVPADTGIATVALADALLDDIRGGFEYADTNLRFSFGIERAVFINGELMSTTVLNLRDMQWAAGAGNVPQVAVATPPSVTPPAPPSIAANAATVATPSVAAAPPTDVPPAATIASPAPAATVASAPPPAVVASQSGGTVIQNGAGNLAPATVGTATVIQNTLNDQAIKTVTTINAAVNSARVLRAMSIQAAVHNGLINSLRR